MINIKYLVGLLCLSATLQAQNAKHYEVAIWHQFKTVALSYTFDDNCANQLPVALPLFDQYGYKTTHFTVSGWIKDWDGLRKAAANGHEIASHTVTHPHLSQLSLEEQDAELENAKSTIMENIPESACETIAYPFCDIGDMALIRKYYSAGRVCTNQIEASTPSDFYAISSIPVGDQSNVAMSKALDSVAILARKSNGWAVFLLHGIDGDRGYSPISSLALKEHLKFVNADSAQYWVATFAHVFKYIRERNALVLTERPIRKDTLQLSVTDSLDNKIYNVPVTVRRVLPRGWSQASIDHNGSPVASRITSQGKDKYIVFDVVPDHGPYVIVKQKRH